MSIEFSVAINAYNRESEIGETLDAVLAQSKTPIQVVVVDDGSTDATGDVVASFGERVEYLRIENVGPGQSRHAAVMRCHAPWVATCDSDDLWTPGHLEAIGETVDAFPGAGLVFTNTTRFGPNERGDYDHFRTLPEDWWESAIVETTGSHRLFGKDAYSNLLAYNPVYPSCSAFDAAVYRRIGGAHPPLSRITSEDSDITRRFALAGHVACNAGISVRMRKHAGNFSESMATNQLGKYRILDRHVRELDLPDELARAAAAERDQALVRAFRHACWEENVERADECLRAMRGKYPIGLKDRLRHARLIVRHRLGRLRHE